MCSPRSPGRKIIHASHAFETGGLSPSVPTSPAASSSCFPDRDIYAEDERQARGAERGEIGAALCVVLRVQRCSRRALVPLRKNQSIDWFSPVRFESFEFRDQRLQTRPVLWWIKCLVRQHSGECLSRRSRIHDFKPRCVVLPSWPSINAM